MVGNKFRKRRIPLADVRTRTIENCPNCGGILTRSGHCNKCSYSTLAELRFMEPRRKQ